MLRMITPSRALGVTLGLAEGGAGGGTGTGAMGSSATARTWRVDSDCTQVRSDSVPTLATVPAARQVEHQVERDRACAGEATATRPRVAARIASRPRARRSMTGQGPFERGLQPD